MEIPSIESLNTGSKRGEFYIKKQFPEFYASLPKDDRRFPEILYTYYYGPAPKCPVCGNAATFISFTKGYSKYCSSKCANTDPAKKLKVEQTCLKKYGHRASSQARSIKAKAKLTCLKKYGDDYQHKQLQKRIVTNLQKYGFEHGLMSPAVREKIKQTCQERYGVDNVLLIPGQIDKLRQAIKDKYGVENVLQLPGIREKIHRTNMERYGASTPFNSSEIQKKCAKHDTGIERFIQTILDENDVQYIREDYTIIPDARVDFYMPLNNVIVEVNGTYWHSDKCKHPQHHLLRNAKAANVECNMITIWEDQINRIPQIVESVVLSKLGIYKRRIGARKCRIVKIDGKIANNFLDNNHIQGRTSSKIKLGAYVGDELVGVMTFIQSRGCQGSKQQMDGQWELNRFCTLLNTQVIGLTSKMLRYFINHYQPTSIISFSHNDISDGNVYSKLGFTKVSKPCTSYYYIKANKRYHRSNFTRAGIVRKWPEYDVNDKSWTERSVMDEKGYYRIYDCGTQKWLLNLT